MPLRVTFVDFWHGADPEKQFGIAELLAEIDYVKVKPEDRPDLCISSVFGRKALTLHCRRLLYCGENFAGNHDIEGRNMNPHEYSNFDWIFATNFPGTVVMMNKTADYSYLPYFAVEHDIRDIMKIRGKTNWEEHVSKKTDFCCFVTAGSYSDHPGHAIRDNFFRRLSARKHVDSAGSNLNNMPGGYTAPRGDEFISWLSKYKFVIYLENSSAPGYITEKIPNAYRAGVVPIYWGHESSLDVLNPNSLVWVDPNNMEAAIERIMFLDSNIDEYMKVLTANPFLQPALLSREPIIAKMKEIGRSLMPAKSVPKTTNSVNTSPVPALPPIFRVAEGIDSDIYDWLSEGVILQGKDKELAGHFLTHLDAIRVAALGDISRGIILLDKNVVETPDTVAGLIDVLSRKPASADVVALSHFTETTPLTGNLLLQPLSPAVTEIPAYWMSEKHIRFCLDNYDKPFRSLPTSRISLRLFLVEEGLQTVVATHPLFIRKDEPRYVTYYSKYGY